MRFYSPLRYPGGKNKLSQNIASICRLNKTSEHYVEPYAGGASVALFLLFNRYVREITINDYDKAIYAFWHSAVYDTERLCKRIARCNITVENWYKQKKIQDNKENENDLLKLGFSTFFLNRTNYSGIIDGGMIGGVDQKSDYKIDCRFNKSELINRIKFISIHKKFIHIKNMDALKLIDEIKKDKSTIFYFDPPYYLKGPSLYMNHYNHDDHEEVCRKIKKIRNAKWIVSYDNTRKIKELYKGFRRVEYSFYHTAYTTRIGKEVLFFSNNLALEDNCLPELSVYNGRVI